MRTRCGETIVPQPALTTKGWRPQQVPHASNNLPRLAESLRSLECHGTIRAAGNGVPIPLVLDATMARVAASSHWIRRVRTLLFLPQPSPTIPFALYPPARTLLIRHLTNPVTGPFTRRRMLDRYSNLAQNIDATVSIVAVIWYRQIRCLSCGMLWTGPTSVVHWRSSSPAPEVRFVSPWEDRPSQEEY
jgi:hypothetical protein